MRSQLQVFKKEVLRYPRLDTVLMIEGAIRKSKGDLTARKIWQKLLVMLDQEGKLTWDISYLDGTFAPAKKGDQK